MSHYGVNSSIPKTLVNHLIKWYADHRASSELKRILYDILAKEISPELKPPNEAGEIEQKTEDLIGPYTLTDFFIFHHLRNGFSPEKIYYLALETFKGDYTADEIMHWLESFYQRFYPNQFKREPMPPGPKVGSVSVSPRGDLRLPHEGKNLCRFYLGRLERLKAGQR